MKTLSNPIVTQKPSPGTAKKEWRKPVLDKLELQNAEHGVTRQNDGYFTHRSH